MNFCFSRWYNKEVASHVDCTPQCKEAVLMVLFWTSPTSPSVKKQLKEEQREQHDGKDLHKSWHTPDTQMYRKIMGQ